MCGEESHFVPTLKGFDIDREFVYMKPHCSTTSVCEMRRTFYPLPRQFGSYATALKGRAMLEKLGLPRHALYANDTPVHTFLWPT